MITCQKCNFQQEDGAKFCSHCGAPLAAEPKNSAEPTIPAEPAEPKKKKGTSKLLKILLIVGGAILLVIVAALAAFFFLRKTPIAKVHHDYSYYLKDDELFISDINKNESWQVTNHLLSGDEMETEDLVSSTYTFGRLTQMSTDGKLIFYIDKLEEESASLFYRFVDKPEEDPIKIDSDVLHYAINDAGDLVTYIKGEDHVLYQHDLNEKEKIDIDVSGFQVSEDGTKLAYLTSEGNLYLKYADQEEEKLAGNISGIEYVNDDFTTVFYKKDDALYKLEEGEKEVKIASNVSSVFSICETGELYFTKENKNNASLLSYVQDDMKKKDAALKEPVYPESPSYWDYYDYEDYYAAQEKYERAYAKYQSALDAWYEKESRDELRSQLAEITITDNSYTLYYYDGTKEKVLSKNYAYFYDYSNSDSSLLMVFAGYKKAEINKVKLSDITDIYAVEEAVYNALYSKHEVYAAVNDQIHLIDQTEATNFAISSDAQTVYFMDDVSDKTNHGDIYKMTITEGKPQKPELYDSDAYTYLVLNSNDRPVYYKDAGDSDGDLYIDKECIDYDVERYKTDYIKEIDTYFYFTDWDDEKEYGTLKFYKDNKSTKVSDDVHSYELTPQNEILYLYDYNTKYHAGTLFLYKEEEPERIDDDVIAIIPITDYTGSLYYY